MKIYLKGLNPSTVYQNTVYDQIGVVESRGGTQFGVFDPDMTLNEDEIGTWIKRRVSLLLGKTTNFDHSSDKSGIYPNEDDPTGMEKHEFAGEVLNIAPIGEMYDVYLDTGEGAVHAIANESQRATISVGDLISIRSLRVDVSKDEEHLG